MSNATDYEMHARARAHLQAQGAALSPEEIRDRVLTSIEPLAAAVRAFDVSKLDTVLDEDWSPRMALHHVVSYNLAIATQILTACLMGYAPPFEPQELEGDVEAVLAKYREGIDSLWEHVVAADPQAFLDVTWPHMWFGELNWREWYVFLQLHHRDHAGQLEKMRTALADG